MKETILITGASGTIGRELVRYLLSKKICIRIAARDEKKIPEFVDSNCPIVPFDYEKEETFERAFDGISGIYLSAPIRHPRVDEFVMPAIEAAKQHGVSHIVTLGSIGIELDNETPLSIMEKCVQYSGLQYSILRPNLLMQNILVLSAEDIKMIRQIRLPAGDARISFVDARDVAESAGKALTDPIHKNKIYNLTGNKALSHSDIARVFSKISGKTITYIPVSQNEARENLLKKHWDLQKANAMIGLYEIARHGWCEDIYPDLEKILEREPVSFEQFAEDYKALWN